jgi:Leucine-rich repeat (LRR) protein
MFRINFIKFRYQIFSEKFSVKQSQITSLYESHNRISDLSNIIQFSSLTVVLLEFNCIEYIESLKLLGNLHRLQTLTLRGNPICSLPIWTAHVRYICQHLKKLDRQSIDRFPEGQFTRDQLLELITRESLYLHALRSITFVLQKIDDPQTTQLPDQLLFNNTIRKKN